MALVGAAELPEAHGAEAGGMQRRIVRVQGSECRVQGSGFRVQGSGCRVQGSGFKAKGTVGLGRGS